MRGPLVDAVARGARFTLIAREPLDGRDCYRIEVRTGGGARELVWVDAASFLEVRLDRPTWGRDGRPGTTTVRYRDWRQVQGLQLPSVMEIGGGPDKAPDRMVIEKVAINPHIDDARFDRPSAPPHKATITIPPTPAQPPR